VRIQTVDLGSSSLKLALYDIVRRDVPATPVRTANARFDPGDTHAAVESTLRALAQDATPDAVVHRVVFGGSTYVKPVIATDEVLRDLSEFAPLEPLHLAPQIAVVRAVEERYPNVPQILCFDSAFHQDMPAIAQRAPLPRTLGLDRERFGFHGLSYEYVTSVLDTLRGRTVIAHLGAGASLCALIDGHPMDTTMGISPLGGLMMASRPGDLDPGLLLYLLRARDASVDSLTDLLYRRSGLLGVSGTTGDMQQLLAAAPHDSNAREAVNLFVYQLRKHLGAMVAAIDGIDRLVFTGGIGENSPQIRTEVCDKLAYLGVKLDPDANSENRAVISGDASEIDVRVVRTNESLMLARHALDVLAASPAWSQR
jgi:acetate kinase